MSPPQISTLGKTMSHLIQQPHETYRLSQAARTRGQDVGVVMTMGALHEGHLSLVRTARDSCDFVIVTIFVNPTQFGEDEDFSAYPRPLDRDVSLLDDLAVDLIFAPSANDIYGGHHSTSVQPPQVAEPLEGRHRPDHFQGVCTVVAKLLNITDPHKAFFGEKDYQQYLVVRDMVRQLNFPAEIIACPTMREPDGLAMSSRNTYLSREDREVAVAIPRALALAQRLIEASEHDARVVESRMQDALQHDRISLDYASIVDVDTLQPLDRITGPVLAAVAARVGSTRLIDNRRIGS